MKIVELLEKCSVKLGHQLVEVVAGRKALVDGGLYFKPGLLDELKRLKNVLPDLELIQIGHFLLFFIVVLLATRAHSRCLVDRIKVMLFSVQEDLTELSRDCEGVTCIIARLVQVVMLATQTTVSIAVLRLLSDAQHHDFIDFLLELLDVLLKLHNDGSLRLLFYLEEVLAHQLVDEGLDVLVKLLKEDGSKTGSLP